MIINCTAHKAFKDKVLITNDTGRFEFLTKDEFTNFVNGTINCESNLTKRLIDKYFLSNDPPEVYYRMVEEAIRDNKAYLFSPTSLFILAVTNACNHRCIYCQAHGTARQQKMGTAIARKAVDRISESPARQITIEFQGGEPLLNYPVIRDVVLYAKEKLVNKSVNFSVVSNLSLITEEIASFFKENHVSVSTSLDGPAFLHEHNRPMVNGNSSYQAMLNGKSILTQWGIHVGAIETTTRETLPYAKDIIKEYVSQGYDSIFLRPLTRIGNAATNWNDVGYSADEYLSFYKEALFEIIELNKQGIHFSETFACLLLTKLFGMQSSNYMELRSPCGAGIGQVAITANGDVFTCDEGRMLSELGDYTFKTGNVMENGYDEWMNSPVCGAVVSASLLEALPICSQCVYHPYCGVCPVANYAVEGQLHSQHPKNDRCQIYGGILDILMELFYQNDIETLKVLRRWISEE